MGDFGNPLAALQQQGFAPPDEQQPAAAPPQVPPIAATSSGQPIPPQSGRPGTLKSMLFNFMQGAGESMIHEAGGQTPWEKQQEQTAVQQRQQQIDQAGQQIKSMIEFHKAQAQREQLTSLSPEVIAANPDLAPYAGLQGTPKDLASLVGRIKSQAMAGQAKRDVAQTTGEFGVQKAQVAAGAKSATDNELWHRAFNGDAEAKSILAAKEKEKIRVAGAKGVSYNATKYVGTIDPDTQELKIEPVGEAAAAGHVLATQGMPLMSKEAQFEDIKQGSQSLRSSIKDLDREFTAEQRAKLTLAMRAPTDSVAANEFNALLGTTELTDKQRAYVIATKQLKERALSLRALASMGRGNIQQQHAIEDTLPSVLSADRKYALQQLDALDSQVDILHKGLPKMGKQPAAATTPAAPKRRVIDFTK